MQLQEKEKIKKEKKAVLFSCLFILLFTALIINSDKSWQSKVATGLALKQEQIVAGHPVKWTMLVKKEDLTNGKHIVKLPKGAKDIKVSNLSKEEANNFSLEFL